MHVTPSLVKRLLDFWLPARCLGCSRFGVEVGPLGLCLGCRGRLRKVQGDPACAVCGESPATAAQPSNWVCVRCRAVPPGCFRLITAYWYTPPLDAVVKGLKFDGLEYLGRHLGEALSAEIDAERLDCDVVAHVPLHWWRRARRGFDQAELIARALASRAGLPFTPLLRRRRATARQTGLGRRARQQNPRGAFEARPGIAVGGRRILLVDDIVTTGATLSEAALCLRAAGASRIVAVAVARTPLGRDRG